MGEFSTFLFARPTFAEGMGRVLDFGNTMSEYNRSVSAEQADLTALWMDWGAIGFDLRQEIEEARSGIEQSKQGSR